MEDVMFRNLIMSAAVSACMISTAYAQDGDGDGWTGEASLTGSKTTGNTETTDVGLGLKLKNENGLWRHKFKANADYGEASGENNKQRFALGYQVDRDINERLYVYGNADYYQDDFGAFKSGYFVGGGAGYKVILPEPINWNLEGGPGYRSQKSRLVLNNPTGLPSIRENEFAVRGFSDFDWQINEQVSFYNDTEIIWSDSDTYIWNEVGLTANLIGNLAARASFRIDNHSDVPAGREKTDTITRFGVVYTMD